MVCLQYAVDETRFALANVGGNCPRLDGRLRRQQTHLSNHRTMTSWLSRIRREGNPLQPSKHMFWHAQKGLTPHWLTTKPLYGCTDRHNSPATNWNSGSPIALMRPCFPSPKPTKSSTTPRKTISSSLWVTIGRIRTSFGSIFSTTTSLQGVEISGVKDEKRKVAGFRACECQ
jgi:hypothetical protein